MSKKSIEQTVQSEVTEIGENISGHLKDALENARDWKDDAESFIKKSPVLCLAGAFLVGFALSKVARHA